MRCGAFARSRLLLAGRVGVSGMLAAARYFFDVGDEIGLGGSDGDGGTTCEVCAVCFAHFRYIGLSSGVLTVTLV